MATISAGRIRSLCRRHNQAHAAVHHFSPSSARHLAAGLSPIRSTEKVSAPSAGQWFRAAVRGRWRRQVSPNSLVRATSQFNPQETNPMQKTLLIGKRIRHGVVSCEVRTKDLTASHIGVGHPLLDFSHRSGRAGYLPVDKGGHPNSKAHVSSERERPSHPPVATGLLDNP
jgi:hypothetical protein